MQLSLLEYLPELDQRIYLDVFAQKKVDKRTRRVSLLVLDGQQAPRTLKVRCNSKWIPPFPDGTVFKLDLRLVRVTRKRPYFSAIRSRQITRAIEFFDHNLKLQLYHTRKVSGKMGMHNLYKTL